MPIGFPEGKFGSRDVPSGYRGNLCGFLVQSLAARGSAQCAEHFRLTIELNDGRRRDTENLAKYPTLPRQLVGPCACRIRAQRASKIRQAPEERNRRKRRSFMHRQCAFIPMGACAMSPVLKFCLALTLLPWFKTRGQDGYLGGYDHDKWHQSFYQKLQRPDTRTPCCNSRIAAPPLEEWLGITTR